MDLFFGSKAQNAGIDIADDHLTLPVFFSYSLQAGKGLKDKSICSGLSYIIDELIKISIRAKKNFYSLFFEDTPELLISGKDMFSIPVGMKDRSGTPGNIIMTDKSLDAGLSPGFVISQAYLKESTQQ